MRRERLTREIVPAPPAELTDDPGRYRESLKGDIRRIADGLSVGRAIGELPRAVPPPVAEIRKALGPAIPPADRNLSPEEIARRQAAESRTRRLTLLPAPADEGDPAA